MAKKSGSNFDDPIPQVAFVKYLMDNSGRKIDDDSIYEIIERFGAEVIIKPALAFISG